jgi:hypothetical protein
MQNVLAPKYRVSFIPPGGIGSTIHNPAEILPYGMSRKILFFFDDVKILYNYMFSYLSCQVNELYIIVEVM